MRSEQEIKSFLDARWEEWVGFSDDDIIRLLKKVSTHEIDIIGTLAIMRTLEWVLGKDANTMLWEIDNA